MNNNKSKTNRGRGRPARVISFNFGKNRPFTVLDVFNRYRKTKPISKVAIGNKVAAMLRRRAIKVVKRNTEGRGRPAAHYQLRAA